jgi:L-ascorbate metabolism protein UlaG (beta-lactamase superfamily)
MARRGWIRRLLGRAALVLLVLLVGLVATGWRDFGHRAIGVRRVRMERSPQWRDGHFVNPQPLRNDLIASLVAMRELSPNASPHAPVPIAAVELNHFDTLPPSGLRVTWLGHSTSLIEIDGVRVLADPVWSRRPSPFRWIGPQRYYQPLIAIADLPRIDVVVISHDHYDHLDYATVVALTKTAATFVVPLGVGAHLEYWGVPLDRIVELDWWETHKAGPLKVTCTPARHASGRTGFFDNDATLWAGFAMTTDQHRVYYSGDTGLFPGMNEIGKRLGPFDVALIEAGQHHRTWPDWHIGPEQAVNANIRVTAKKMMPVHWGLFTLGYHTWTEPVERAVVAANASHVDLLTPRVGEPVEPTRPYVSQRWWPALPWQNAAQHPIVSTQVPR